METAHGPRTVGPLESLREGWFVRLGGQKPATAPAGDLIVLRRADKKLPPPPVAEQLMLRSGDRIPFLSLRIVGERVLFVPYIAEGKEMTLPLSAVSVIWFSAPDGTERPEVRRRELAAAVRRRDVVLLRNGDVREGIVNGLDAAAPQPVSAPQLRLEVDRKSVSVERSKVAAIALSTELGGTPRAKGPYGRLILSNGTRLSLTSAACADGKALTGTTLFGAAVRIPSEDLVALYVFEGPAVYLSDLKPSRCDYTPYNGPLWLWPWVADGSVDRRGFRLKDGSYDKGLGVHSKTELTYDLARAYRSFEAVVGLDEQTGRGGSVRVRVLLDGKPQNVGGDRDLTSANGPFRIRLNVTSARELTLVTDFGEGGDAHDHVNWVDARLIR
jgi:hypothetical protein